MGENQNSLYSIINQAYFFKLNLIIFEKNQLKAKDLLLVSILAVVTRSRVSSLFIHLKKISIPNNLLCFSNLAQVTRNTIKTTYNNLVKSKRFDSLVEDLSFQNPKI